MMASAASRTRVFTATWPAYAPATHSAVVAARAERRHGEHQPGPYYQVELRRSVQPGTVADGFSSDTDTEGDLVFLERRLLLRSYNSVSLSDDGAYRLTLADCHGFASVSSSSREQKALPVPPYIGGNPDYENDERGGFGDSVEIIRLFFVPLPHIIEFSVDGGQVARGNPVVGNFHLLPVAHVPQLQNAPLRASAAHPATADIDRTDHGQRRDPPQDSEEADNFYPPRTTGRGQACKSDCGGDGFGKGSPERSSSRGCFVSGAVVGVLLGILSAWLVVVKGLGKERRERFWNWCVGVNVANADGQRVMAGAREERKAGGIHVIGDGEQPSEDGSTDSDVILDGNVPEPVGLPRSEEDWRALFDTLYEDQADVDAAEAREAAPLVPQGSDGQMLHGTHKDEVVRDSPTEARNKDPNPIVVLKTPL